MLPGTETHLFMADQHGPMSSGKGDCTALLMLSSAARSWASLTAVCLLVLQMAGLMAAHGWGQLACCVLRQSVRFDLESGCTGCLVYAHSQTSASGCALRLQGCLWLPLVQCLSRVSGPCKACLPSSCLWLHHP